MQGRNRSGSGRRNRALPLVTLTAAMGLFAFCGPPGEKGSDTTPPAPPTDNPIPAPPQAFGDTTPASAYVAYAQTLDFDTVNSARTRHDSAGSVSRLRISPERRLVTTADAVFNEGRIIAVMRTDSGVSPYGTPIGTAYLWVRRIGAQYQAKIITAPIGVPGGGQIIAVPGFYHVPLPSTIRLTTFCVTLDSIRAGTCCRCASGCWNPWPVPMPPNVVDSLVRTIVTP